MERLKRIESKGYKVQVYASGGGAIATKNGRTIKGTSISNLHKLIFGY